MDKIIELVGYWYNNFPLTWRVDLQHIPFTRTEVYGNINGIPILGIYYIIFLIGLVYLYGAYMYSKRRYGGYLYTKHGYILIGGKFENGKTRLLAQFAQDVYQKDDTFVIANYSTKYAFLKFSSFDDFANILDDLLLLGEYQNFTDKEAEEIQKDFPAYFSTDDREMLKKYVHIPANGNNCNFLLEGDEFHQYLYSRNSMSNFSGERGERLLQTMHQVRHYNTLCALATQDLDDLDLKLRRLASYEIDTLNYWGIFFGYNFFKYELNKRKTQKEDDAREYRIINKFFPVLFFNTYSFNFLIADFERIYNGLFMYGYRKANKIFGKNWIWKFRTFERKKELDFQSKFNVKLEKSIYKKGDLFKKLNRFYREKKQLESVKI